MKVLDSHRIPVVSKDAIGFDGHGTFFMVQPTEVPRRMIPVALIGEDEVYFPAEVHHGTVVKRNGVTCTLVCITEKWHIREGNENRRLEACKDLIVA